MKKERPVELDGPDASVQGGVGLISAELRPVKFNRTFFFHSQVRLLTALPGRAS